MHHTMTNRVTFLGVVLRGVSALMRTLARQLHQQHVIALICRGFSSYSNMQIMCTDSRQRHTYCTSISKCLVKMFCNRLQSAQ